MKYLIFLGACILFSCVTTNAIDKPRSLPIVFILNADVLKSNKSRIASKDVELMPAYKKLLKDADKALTEGPFSVMEKTNTPPSGDKHDYMSLAPYFWPDPTKPDGLPYIRKDGQTNPEVKNYKDKEYQPKMCEMVHTLALAYYFSADEQYAEHAAKLLKVWFLNAETKMNPNLNFGQAIKGVNTGRAAGLIDVRHYMKVIDAIGLLHGSKHWTDKQQTGMKEWFSAFLNWMQTSPIGVDEMKTKNNHGTYYDALRLSLALFIGDKELAKKVVESATQRLNSQMDDEGKFPLEMERTIALHYNVFNLLAFYMIASMAEELNVDMWNYKGPQGASLKRGFDFLYPFITRQKEWQGQQIKPFEFEESYPLLMISAVKHNCRQCREDVMRMAADDAQKLRENLLY